MRPIKYLLAATLVLLVSVIHAEKVGYQSWVADLNGQTNEAYAVNESNSSFGVFCSGEKCLFYLRQSLQCNPGAKYSVLVNSEIISTALTMECTQIGGSLFQILNPFETLLMASQTGGAIGFAVALQSGAFAVTRFTLAGAKQAIERVLTEAAKSKFKGQEPPVENTPKSSFKDIAI